ERLAPTRAPRLSVAERMDRLRRLKQAEELAVTWRMLLGVTDAEGFSREMTELAEAALSAAWLLALDETAAAHGVPWRATGELVGACIVGLGTVGGRQLATGPDLD